MSFWEELITKCKEYQMEIGWKSSLKDNHATQNKALQKKKSTADRSDLNFLAQRLLAIFSCDPGHITYCYTGKKGI